MEILELFLGVGFFLACYAEGEPPFKYFLDEEGLPYAAAAIDGDELRLWTADVVVELAFFLFTPDDG